MSSQWVGSNWYLLAISWLRNCENSSRGGTIRAPWWGWWGQGTVRGRGKLISYLISCLISCLISYLIFHDIRPMSYLISCPISCRISFSCFRLRSWWGFSSTNSDLKMLTLKHKIWCYVILSAPKDELHQYFIGLHGDQLLPATMYEIEKVLRGPTLSKATIRIRLLFIESPRNSGREFGKG